ncbi:ABC transporter ATP-binding protein [Streptomyces asiaticus]
MTDDLVLRAEHLDVVYDGPRPTRAVRDVGFDLRRGELLGIAGESGCGKSTLAYAVGRMLRPPARLTGGRVVHYGRDGTETDVLALEGEALRAFRWSTLSIVFQSAMNALNPVTTVGRQFDDIFRAHRPAMRRPERYERARALLDMVGIDPARVRAYPHELSGGMRQRVVIAMALALDPEIVIMDEPTTALDVVVQREILDEVQRLRDELGFSVVFITHDLSLLLEISDRLAVMYAGAIVEHGPAERIARPSPTTALAGLAKRGPFDGPAHPYTQGLLRSFPDLAGERRELRGIPGSPPDLRENPPGCPFAARCDHAYAPCFTDPPRPLPVAPAGAAACHLLSPTAPSDAPGAAAPVADAPGPAAPREKGRQP